MSRNEARNRRLRYLRSNTSKGNRMGKPKPKEKVLHASNLNEVIDIYLKYRPAWTTLERDENALKMHIENVTKMNETSDVSPLSQDALKIPEAMYVNSRYVVQVYDASEQLGIPMKHLSIRNNENNHMAHDWRDLQRIKNEICGEEKEAIELYPAMSRMVDTSNQYHLWVFMEDNPIKIGWKNSAILQSQQEAEHVAAANDLIVPHGGKKSVRQRDMEEGFVSAKYIRMQQQRLQGEDDK